MTTYNIDYTIPDMVGYSPFPTLSTETKEIDTSNIKQFNGISSPDLCKKDVKKSALDIQVNGSHYKGAKIQPIEFIHANNIPFIEGNIIKYIFRWRDKNGTKDLEKIKHYIDLLIELESRNV